ncbi:MAG: rRNA maturation RNase YbeY [Candidatus Curtissbacteria bacterium]|nr:rRNA maturation RNase YbeY [Candidatus Curtissbacteria bacterium]
MIKVLISTDPRYPVNRKVLRKAVLEVFEKEKIVDIDAEVSVSVVGRRKMKALTDKYLKDSRNHEVLSFPIEDPSTRSVRSGQEHGFAGAPDEVLRLGDVVLCWPEVLLCAAKDDVMVDAEVLKLTAHGVEHLLGKHHE